MKSRNLITRTVKEIQLPYMNERTKGLLVASSNCWGTTDQGSTVLVIKCWRIIAFHLMFFKWADKNAANLLHNFKPYKKNMPPHFLSPVYFSCPVIVIK